MDEFADATAGETLWVAEGAAGEILAFASVWREPGLWFLHNLFVAPERQNRGIGRALLTALLGRVGRPVELKADIANAIARRFYTSFGFRVVEQGAARPLPWIKMRLD